MSVERHTINRITKNQARSFVRGSRQYSKLEAPEKANMGPGTKAQFSVDPAERFFSRARMAAKDRGEDMDATADRLWAKRRRP